jgi:hypothetical protein
MVDAENLFLLQRSEDAGIEFAGRVLAVAERLLDDNPAPEPGSAMRLRHPCQPALAEPVYDRSKESVRDGEIEDDVAERMALLRNRFKVLSQFAIKGGIVDIAFEV